MKNYDLYHARRIGQHRRFPQIVKPNMVLLADRGDGSFRRELVRDGFCAPSDGLLWFPDVRDRVTLSLLETVVFGVGPCGSLSLEELVDQILSKLDALEPPVTAPLPTSSPWTSIASEPPEGVRVLVSGGKTEEDRWFSVARRERLRAFVGDELVATGPWTLTWYDPMEGVRIAEGAVRYWMLLPPLPAESPG